MSKSHDTIAKRLALILTKLNDGDEFSIDELSKEFGVSTRTTSRDLNERLAFLPIVKKCGKYSLEPYCLGKLSFKDIKNFATISGIRQLYPAIDDEFIADILNIKVNKAYMIKGYKYEDTSEYIEQFQQINLSILKRFKLSFIYDEKQRYVDPYKLVNIFGIWYLSADENNKLKTYSLTKIKELKVTKQLFEPNKKFQDIIEKNKTVWFSQDSIEVLLDIDISVLPYFQRRDLLSNQKIKHIHKEYFELTATVSYEEEILKFARYWIPHIKIISPATLQDKLESQLAKYLKEHI